MPHGKIMREKIVENIVKISRNACSFLMPVMKGNVLFNNTLQ